jgi:MoaA/NifB/PqqE/SkfB family radical SAM enzyme
MNATSLEEHRAKPVKARIIRVPRVCPRLSAMTVLEGLRAIGFPRLSGATLEATTQCNLRCPHCWLSQDERSSKAGFLDVDKLSGILAILSRNGCHSVSLAGGEPLLHPALPSILKLCRRANMDISFYTNGTLFDEASLSALRSTPGTLVIVSLYGASDEDYQKLAVNKTSSLFGAVRSGIAVLQAARIPYKLQFFSYPGREHIYDELQRIFPEVRIAKAWMVIPRSRLERCNQNHMHFPEDLRERIHIRRQPEFIWPLHDFLYEQKTITGCAAGLTQVYISADLKLRPCIFSNDPDLTFSLEDDSFEDIFYDKMLKTLLKPIPSTSPCGSCRLRRSCPRCHPFGYGTDWAAEHGERSCCAVARVVDKKFGANARL